MHFVIVCHTLFLFLVISSWNLHAMRRPFVCRSTHKQISVWKLQYCPFESPTFDNNIYIHGVAKSGRCFQIGSIWKFCVFCRILLKLCFSVIKNVDAYRVGFNSESQWIQMLSPESVWQTNMKCTVIDGVVILCSGFVCDRFVYVWQSEMTRYILATFESTFHK